MERLTIGRLARAAGVGVETIRYYQRRGLLEEPPRPEAGYRLYPPEAVRKLRFIRRAQRAGFSLREIKDLMGLGALPGADCGQVLALTRRKVEEIEARIGALEAIKTSLEELAQACPGRGALSGCPIWESLEEDKKVKEVMGHG